MFYFLADLEANARRAKSVNQPLRSNLPNKNGGRDIGAFWRINLILG